MVLRDLSYIGRDEGRKREGIFFFFFYGKKLAARSVYVRGRCDARKMAEGRQRKESGSTTLAFRVVFVLFFVLVMIPVWFIYLFFILQLYGWMGENIA